MDYKSKYRKYFDKFTHNYSSLITDKIIYDNCEQPEFIRVLQHPVTKKIVILLGESHADLERSNRFARIDPNKGYDLILGQISKRISYAQDKPDNVFHKVLLLNEQIPHNLLLGGKKELDPSLLDQKYLTGSLRYIDDKFYYMSKKYKNVIARGVNIRNNLEIFIYIFRLKKDVDEDRITPDIIKEVQLAISNIKKYIINDELYKNEGNIGSPPFGDEENKQFFGNSYNRRPSIFPRRLSEIFISTKQLYANLRELFIEYIDKIDKIDKIEDQIKFFLTETSVILVARIMDLYVLEYIHLMDNNTTTVLYAGSAHTRFLFNKLVVIDGYKILEIEKKYNIYNNVFNIKECQKVFPSFDTNLDNLNFKYNNITKLYYYILNLYNDYNNIYNSF